MHKLSPSYLQKPAYGAMPLEPAETRRRSNFPESGVPSKVQLAKLNTDETILMAGTEYFGETAVQPHNHTLSRHLKKKQWYTEKKQWYTEDDFSKSTHQNFVIFGRTFTFIVL